MSPAEAASLALGILLQAHTTMAAVAVTLVAWSRRRRAAPSHPPLTVLRPLEGLDAGLEANLAAFYDAPWPAPRQVILCTANEGDPAVAVARAVAGRYPHIPTAFATSDGGPAWPNRKIRHLLAGLPLAAHGTLVFADADMGAPPGLLDALVAPLADDGVGIVYGASSYRAEGGLAPALQSAALGRGFHAFAVLAALSDFTGGVPAMVGGLWATRRDALTRLGGLQVAAAHIGDDLALAEAAYAAGIGVRLSPEPALCVEPGLRLGPLFQRLRRWVAVLGAHQPHKLAGYPALIAHLPLLLAVAALGAAAGAPAPGPLLAATLTSRWLMALYLGRVNRLPWRPGLLLEVLAADALLLAAFFAAVGRSTVVWRGRTYRLAPGGAIEEVR